MGSSHILHLCGSFDSLQADFCRGLLLSHGGGEADRVAQPPPWRFQDSGQTKHYSRQHDRNGGSRHATSHAVADTAHRADQINVKVSRACRQASVQSASLPSPRQPEPFLTCGLDTVEPHTRSPLIAAGTKIPHTRGHRARKERNQSLSRHLAARTLCGSLAEIRQGSTSLADGGVLL